MPTNRTGGCAHFARLVTTGSNIDPAAVSIIVDEDIHEPIGTGFYFIQREFFITAKQVVEYGSHDTVRAGTLRKNLVVMQTSAGGPYPKARV